MAAFWDNGDGGDTNASAWDGSHMLLDTARLPARGLMMCPVGPCFRAVPLPFAAVLRRSLPSRPSLQGQLVRGTRKLN